MYHGTRLRKVADGFTLIEMLVVIAIIALLISILLPSLAQARNAARNTHCMSNLKSMALSTQFYLNNNREMFPVRSATSGTGGGSVFGAFEPTRIILTEDKRPFEVAACPNDGDPSRLYSVGEKTGTDPVIGTTGLGIGDLYKLPPDYQIRWSYGLNNMTGLKPTTDAEKLIFNPNSAAYRDTTHTMLYADSAWVNARGHDKSLNDAPKLKSRVANANAPLRFDKLAEIPDEWNRPRVSGKRHQGGNNVVFFDQHGETVSQRTLFAPAVVLYSYTETWDPTSGLTTSTVYPPDVQDPNDPNLPTLP
jgi:prepilin-type N-terminal cleavage/methylation domain-containing protein/prepilin-type processing-associated H-X9-DG protein